MEQYLKLGKEILQKGVSRGNERTGVYTLALFGTEMRFDLIQSFPLVTTKRVAIKPLIAELLWMIEGSDNNNRLNELGAKIWDPWATETGELGPVYGKQWRHWVAVRQHPVTKEITTHFIDQLAGLMDDLKCRPYSRRHIVSAWNPADLPDECISPQENVKMGRMALAPCHYDYQLFVYPLSAVERDTYAVSKDVGLALHEIWYNRDGISRCSADALKPAPSISFRSGTADQLDVYFVDAGWMAEEIHRRYDAIGIPRMGLKLKVNMRSMDVPIGTPFNVASYSLLAMMIAQCAGMVATEMILSGGDTHVYVNQLELFEQQLKRTPGPLPTMKINPLKTNLFDFEMSDFELVGYHPQAAIKYPVVV